jgi:hypothetical protein
MEGIPVASLVKFLQHTGEMLTVSIVSWLIKYFQTMSCTFKTQTICLFEPNLQEEVLNLAEISKCRTKVNIQSRFTKQDF